MGFLSGIIKNAIGDGISKGIGDAISKATEQAFAPTAEKIADNAAQNLNTAAQNINLAAQGINDAASDVVWSNVLANYPKWTFSPISDTSSDETEEYISFSIFVSANEANLDEYRAVLKNAGFVGGDQIQHKVQDGREYCVDFSFAEPGNECEIHYVINKQA